MARIGKAVPATVSEGSGGSMPVSHRLAPLDAGRNQRIVVWRSPRLSQNLLPEDLDVPGCLDAQANLAALELDHRDHDVAVDHDLLIHLAAQYQHFILLAQGQNILSIRPIPSQLPVQRLLRFSGASLLGPRTRENEYAR